MRGDATVRFGCNPDAPTGEQGELQPGDQGLVPAEREGDLGGDRGELLLVGEGRGERVRARPGPGGRAGAADHLAERPGAAAVVHLELVRPDDDDEVIGTTGVHGRLYP